MAKMKKLVSFTCGYETIGSILEQLKQIQKNYPEVDPMEARIDLEYDYGDIQYAVFIYERYETADAR